ncbi:hypothetical protein [uncultured Oscillibacter sp.]|uniref:hypothetical protein n=1 Tax=uncultured Oscillibacter sp. TaxID=876091 RepID=UPI0025D488A4|nr:hypothetical protein [uncultured Oscillibacter sp.]
MKRQEVNVGIGFATGRKNFQRILKTNIYNWRESGLTTEKSIRLNLLAAYDLQYSNTKSTDYTNISKQLLELIDDTYFIGKAAIQKEIDYLVGHNVLNAAQARLIFGRGYAAKRNIILYTALKNNMDYLVFLDDDEYPVAVTNTRSSVIWGGQHVLATHLRNIEQADITNGYHCGYVSPIPFIKFDNILTEQDFRLFIEAISNDIVNWDTIRSVMNNGGVTYADTKVLVSDEAKEVQEVNHTKFISGANLCINLTKPDHISPFYNPPGARGEDTFLSTCLSQRKVLRVPCYAFHDGFSTYQHLMDGVLPIKLKYIMADSEAVTTRFYLACIGWVRYKPLLLYITQRECYDEKIDEMRRKLSDTLPNICAYFAREDFMNISKELERYNKNVKKHYQQFLETQQLWERICKFLANRPFLEK